MVNIKKQNENTTKFINKGITDKIKAIEEQQAILKKDGVSQRFINSLTPDQTNKILNNKNWSYTYPQLFLAYQDKGGKNNYKKFIQVISDNDARQRVIKRKEDQTPYMTTGEISKLVADSVASSAWVGGSLGKLGAIWKGTRAGLKASTRDGITLGELVGKLASAGIKNAKLTAKQLVGIIDRKTTQELIEDESRLASQNQRLTQEDASMLSDKENELLNKANREWSKAKQELKFRRDEEAELLRKAEQRALPKKTTSQSFKDRLETINYNDIEDAIGEQIIQDDKLFPSMEGFYRAKLRAITGRQNYTEEELQLLKNKYNSEINKNADSTYTNLKEKPAEPVEENIDSVESTPLINRKPKPKGSSAKPKPKPKTKGKTKIQPVEKTGEPISNKKTDDILPDDIQEAKAEEEGEPNLPPEYEGFEPMELDEEVQPLIDEADRVVEPTDDESILGKGGKQGKKQPKPKDKPPSNKDIGAASVESSGVKIVEGAIKTVVGASVVSTAGGTVVPNKPINPKPNKVSVTYTGGGGSTKITESVKNFDELLFKTLELSELVYDVERNIGNDYKFLDNESDIPILLNIEDDILYISFRGTDSLSNLITDIQTSDGTGKDINLSDYKVFNDKLNQQDVNIQMHGGFLKQVALFYDTLVNAIESIYNSSLKIILTGHSLGGAISCIFYYIYTCSVQNKDKKIPIFYNINYGSPRFLIDKNNNAQHFNNRCPNLLRCFNKNDIVTYIPFYGNVLGLDKLNFGSGYIHVGRGFNLNGMIETNSINDLLVNILRGQQDKISILTIDKDILLSSKLINSILDDEYLEILNNSFFSCITKLEIRKNINQNQIRFLTKQLEEQAEGLLTWSEKCSLLDGLGFEEIIRRKPLGESQEGQNFNIASLGGIILGFNKQSFKAHSFPAYYFSLNELVKREVYTGEDILTPPKIREDETLREKEIDFDNIVGIFEGDFRSGEFIEY